MAKTYTPVNWEDGTIVKQATVTIDNVEYEVNPAEVEGTTPVTAENLKHMDDAIKELYDEGTTSKDIVIGSEEEATEDTKLLIETDTLASLGTEVVNTLSGNEIDKAPSVQAINKALSYSTEEQVVGTDENGKPIYRKKIIYKNSETIGATGNKTNILIPHSISNLKQIESIKLTNSNNQIFPRADGKSSVTSWTGIANITSTDITLCIINDTWSSRTWYVTLEYTKTTDSVATNSLEEGGNE